MTIYSRMQFALGRCIMSELCVLQWGYQCFCASCLFPSCAPWCRRSSPSLSRVRVAFSALHGPQNRLCVCKVRVQWSGLKASVCIENKTLQVSVCFSQLIANAGSCLRTFFFFLSLQERCSLISPFWRISQLTCQMQSSAVSILPQWPGTPASSSSCLQDFVPFLYLLLCKFILPSSLVFIKPSMK